MIRGVSRQLVSQSTIRGLSSLANDVKPFSDIPTLPGLNLPLLGHLPYLYKKPNGIDKAWKTLRQIQEAHVPPDINLLRLCIPPLNEGQDGRVVYLFDPEDVEQVYRHDDKYPYRGPGFQVLKMMRERKPDMFGETTGVLMEEGEKWQQIRSAIQQDMMRPKSAMFYLKETQDVCLEFVEYIRRNRDPQTLINPGDFLEDFHKFAFESISIIAIDTKMGCLKEKVDPEMAKKLAVGQKVINTFAELLFIPPVWKLFPPRWFKVFRETEDNFIEYCDFIKEKVNDAIKRIDNKAKSDLDDLHEISVLEKFIIKNGPNSPIPFVTAFDMVVAGIDTTGNTLAFMLYNLATNPEAQQKLRDEVMQFDQLSEKELGKMKYFRACLKESFRLTPTINGLARSLSTDLVLKGFHIPAHTVFVWNFDSLTRNQKQFPDPESFRPERWLEGDQIHPFSNLQFSHGPRGCVGRRFAEMEMQLCMAELVKNFHVEWAGDGVVEPVFKLTNMPDRALKFKFHDLNG